MGERDEIYTTRIQRVVTRPVMSPRPTRNLRSPLAPRLVSGLKLRSPSGVDGYIAGKALDGSGRFVFVITEGDDVYEHKCVEMYAAQFRGFMTDDGRTVDGLL